MKPPRVRDTCRGDRPSPSLDAAEWFRVAVELDGENRQLRRWLTDMLVAIANRDDLLALGRAEIAKRWPTEARSRE